MENESDMKLVIIPNIEKIVRMVMSNILRPPQTRKADVLDALDGVCIHENYDPYWKCQKLVYEILFRIVSSDHAQMKILTKLFCTPRFIADFLPLFKTDASAELEQLTKILYMLYVKVSQV